MKILRMFQIFPCSIHREIPNGDGNENTDFNRTMLFPSSSIAKIVMRQRGKCYQNAFYHKYLLWNWIKNKIDFRLEDISLQRNALTSKLRLTPQSGLCQSMLSSIYRPIRNSRSFFILIMRSKVYNTKRHPRTVRFSFGQQPCTLPVFYL